MKKRAVFFDRDGVLIRSVVNADGSTRTPFSFDEFEILPGVREALAAVGKLGYLRIMISNQPDVVYGNLTEEVWQAMQAKVAELPLDDIYICRHGRDEVCACKKPKPGMVLDAAAKWNIDLGRSFFVGDTATDVKTAEASGCVPILLEWPYNAGTQCQYWVRSLAEVFDIL